MGQGGTNGGRIRGSWRALPSGRPRFPRASLEPEPAPGPDRHGTEPRWPADQDPAPRLHRLRTALTGMPGVALAAVLIGVAAAWFASAHDLTMLYADARSHLTIRAPPRRRPEPQHRAARDRLAPVAAPRPPAARLVARAVELGRRRDPGRHRVSRHRGAVALLAREDPDALEARRLARGRVAPHESVDPLPAHHRADRAGAVRVAARHRGDVGSVGEHRQAVLRRRDRALLRSSRRGRWCCRAYDGWAMAAAATVYVLVVAQWRWHQWRYSIHIARCFATLPVLAAGWWMWFNWVNWGDPLEFQRGQYSAQAQQELLAKAGLLPDKGNARREPRHPAHHRGARGRDRARGGRDRRHGAVDQPVAPDAGRARTLAAGRGPVRLLRASRSSPGRS